MSKKIYIPQPIAVEGEEFLKSKGYTIFRGSEKIDTQSLKNDIVDCDAMILRTAKVDKEVLDCCKNMKVIARHGAGYENIDYAYANELGIVSTYSPNSTTISVAEFAIAGILTLAKDFKKFENELRNDNFKFKFSNKGCEVRDKTIGILGFGKIGQEVAKAANFGLGMKVITYLKEGSKVILPDYVKRVSFEDLFRSSDFLTLHIPGGDANKNLVGEKELNLMKSTSFLINASRGGVLDEEAFLKVMKENKISGALIDVFLEEPPKMSNQLFDLDNVILTPHIGSNTDECMVRIGMETATDVHNVLSGSKPLYPIPIMK